MKIFFTLVLALLALCVTAQTVVPQSQAIKNFPTGEYTAYLTHKKPGTDEYQGGVSDRVWRINDISPEKNQPATHYHLRMMSDLSEMDASKPELYEYSFLPDHIAFPVTYEETGYMASAKLQEAIGYVKTRVNIETRIVFLGEHIYFIKEWKSKDDYKLYAVLEPGGTPDGLIKMMKLVAKTPKKMKELDPDAKLKAYLDAAYEEQARYYAEWVKVPKNKQTETAADMQYEAMIKGIKKFNSDYEKTPEFQAMLRNNRLAAEARAESQLTVNNNSGSDVYVYSEGSRNGSRVSAGGSRSFSCDEALYYTSSPSSSVNGGGTRFHGGGGCGSTVSIP